ncbi:hypothetical protein ACET3Z_009115 [Daucus carota]
MSNESFEEQNTFYFKIVRISSSAWSEGSYENACRSRAQKDSSNLAVRCHVSSSRTKINKRFLNGSTLQWRIESVSLARPDNLSTRSFRFLIRFTLSVTLPPGKDQFSNGGSIAGAGESRSFLASTLINQQIRTPSSQKTKMS